MKQGEGGGFDLDEPRNAHRAIRKGSGGSGFFQSRLNNVFPHSSLLAGYF